MLAAHLASDFAKGARFNPARNTYEAPLQGRIMAHCGLLAKLRARHYPQHERSKSRRKYAKTNIRGSTSALGKRVDRELAAEPSSKHHEMTRLLREHWSLAGHRIVACQVPVRVPDFPYCMTEADVLTRDSLGQLWLWEVKTGVPVGFHRRQGVLARMGPGEDVPCTWPNIWQLQLLYTRRALQAAGVPVVGARVIQIHGVRKKAPLEYKIKEWETPGWTQRVQFP